MKYESRGVVVVVAAVRSVMHMHLQHVPQIHSDTRRGETLAAHRRSLWSARSGSHWLRHACRSCVHKSTVACDEAPVHL